MDADTFLRWLADHDVVDLSHPLEEGMPALPDSSRYFHMLWDSYWHGDAGVDYQIILNEHSGTHVDAPAHMMRDEHPAHLWIDQMSATSLVGRAAVIDATDTPPTSDFGLAVLHRFQRESGPIRRGDIALFRTGWSEKWKSRPDSRAYMDGYPGTDVPLAQALVELGVKAVGLDTPSIERFDEELTFPVHELLLANRVMLMENLTNLERLPPFCIVIAIPLAIKGGSGSPIRPLAFVPKNRG